MARLMRMHPSPSVFSNSPQDVKGRESETPTGNASHNLTNELSSAIGFQRRSRSSEIPQNTQKSSNMPIPVLDRFLPDSNCRKTPG